MAKRPDPNRNQTTGWHGEVNQERRDSEVRSFLIVDGPPYYASVYEQAHFLNSQGATREQIESQVVPVPDSSHPDTQIADDLNYHFRRYRTLAIDDAIAGTSPNFQMPAGM